MTRTNLQAIRLVGTRWQRDRSKTYDM